MIRAFRLSVSALLTPSGRRRGILPLRQMGRAQLCVPGRLIRASPLLNGDLCANIGFSL
jgi:hypothetical protein